MSAGRLETLERESASCGKRTSGTSSRAWKIRDWRRCFGKSASWLRSALRRPTFLRASLALHGVLVNALGWYLEKHKAQVSEQLRRRRPRYRSGRLKSSLESAFLLDTTLHQSHLQKDAYCHPQLRLQLQPGSQCRNGRQVQLSSPSSPMEDNTAGTFIVEAFVQRAQALVSDSDDAAWSV